MRERSRIGRSESDRSRRVVGEIDLAAEVLHRSPWGTTWTDSRSWIDRSWDSGRRVVGIVGESQFAEIVERVTGVIEFVASPTAIVVIGSTPHVITHGSVPSDFQELLLFALYRPIDVLDVIMSDLVEFLLCSLDVVR